MLVIIGSNDLWLEMVLSVMEMESVKENMFSARYQRRMSAARVDTGKNDCFHERYLSCGCSHYRRRKELGKEQRMVLIIMMIGRDRMMMMTARGWMKPRRRNGEEMHWCYMIVTMELTVKKVVSGDGEQKIICCHWQLNEQGYSNIWWWLAESIWLEANSITLIQENRMERVLCSRDWCRICGRFKRRFPRQR